MAYIFKIFIVDMNDPLIGYMCVRKAQSYYST